MAPSPEPMMWARDLLPVARRHGNSSLAYSTLDPRLERLTSDGIEGYVAYKRSGKSLIAVFGPVCAAHDVRALVERFREAALSDGCRTTFFGASEDMAAKLRELGYTGYRAARDSRVELEEFSTRGNRMLNVRRGYNHARNVGITWSEYTPGDARDPGLEAACDGISSGWIEDKGGLEIQFILGRADWDDPGERRFFVARSKERVEGFLVYHPVFHERAWYLDMSRRRSDSPNGTMDFLLVESLKLFQEEGAQGAYLGMIPDLSFPEGLNDAGPVLRGVLKALAKRAELFYPVRTETFFKEKYKPVWDDLYFCVEEKISLSQLHDLLKAFQPAGVRGMLGKKLLG